MEIYRFDPEVCLPVSELGSDFRIAPLTGPDSRVQVSIVHIAPGGGGIGSHPAVSRQLLAVVAGSGRTAGWLLRPGLAVLWEPGENHEVTSEEGLTAVCVEGEFAVWAMARTQDIVVEDYDPSWPSRFDEVSRLVWPAVEGIALRIDHVGSTSVPGLAAKPIVDMDVVVASEDDVRPVVDRLRSLGYSWVGDLGVTGRQAFRSPTSTALPRHHLYLVVEDNKAHLDHWLLRDVLRADAGARDRYAELKKGNVELAAGDMDVYVAAKAAFVAELLTRARAERGLPPASYWHPPSG